MRQGNSLTFIFLLLVLAAPTTALGIAQDWHPDRTFEVMQGETYLHRINIQNERNAPITLQLQVGGPYMSIDGEKSTQLTIPARTYNHYEYINITIPENETPGNTVRGTYSVQEVTGGEGQVGLGIRLSDDYTVVVTKSPTPFDRISGQVTETINNITSNKTVLIGVFVLLLAVFLLVVYRQSEILGNLLNKKKEDMPAPETPAIIEETAPTAVASAVVETDEGPPGEAFVSTRGWATSLNELALLVSQMDEETYESHIGKHGNEFANWVYHHTKDYQKYEEVLNTRTKQELVNTLLFSHNE